MAAEAAKLNEFQSTIAQLIDEFRGTPNDRPRESVPTHRDAGVRGEGKLAFRKKDRTCLTDKPQNRTGKGLEEAKATERDISRQRTLSDASVPVTRLATMTSGLDESIIGG